MSKVKNQNRQAFLLTFFPNDEKYATKEVNDFILVKYFSNATHQWEVQIYTKESYSKRQQYLERKQTACPDAEEIGVTQEALL